MLGYRFDGNRDPVSVHSWYCEVVQSDQCVRCVYRTFVNVSV